MKKIIKQLKQIIEELEKSEKPKLEFEDNNFKINSDDWKKITVNGKHYLVNPEEDIWEILDRECRGEQLFTYDAAIRETKKRNKRIPTDEEFTELLQTKDDMPNLVYPGYRYYTGYFSDRGSYAYFWSSSVAGTDAWRRNLYSSEARVSRDTRPQTHGFSVRCLKD